MIYEYEHGIPADVLREALAKSLEGRKLNKVLILPPDFTRMYSGAGKITAIYYDMLKDFCDVDIFVYTVVDDSLRRTYIPSS